MQKTLDIKKLTPIIIITILLLVLPLALILTRQSQETRKKASSAPHISFPAGPYSVNDAITITIGNFPNNLLFAEVTSFSFDAAKWQVLQAPYSIIQGPATFISPSAANNYKLRVGAASFSAPFNGALLYKIQLKPLSPAPADNPLRLSLIYTLADTTAGETSGNEEAQIVVNPAPTVAATATPPPVPRVVEPPGERNFTSTTATIVWTTDVPTTTFLAYSDVSTGFDGADPASWGRWRVNTDNATAASMKTSHSVFIGSLSPSTTYYYRVSGRSYPGAGPLIDNPPAVASFTTSPPPQINQGPSATNIYTNEATITWRTTVNTTSYVAYSDVSTDLIGANPASWGKWRVNADNTSPDAMKTLHSVRIAPLEPGTTYYYRATGRDYPGQGSLTNFPEVASFTTLAIPNPTRTPAPP